MIENSCAIYTLCFCIFLTCRNYLQIKQTDIFTHNFAILLIDKKIKNSHDYFFGIRLNHDNIRDFTHKKRYYAYNNLS